MAVKSPTFRPMLWIARLTAAMLPSCTFCLDTVIPPVAAEHTAFCAQYLDAGKLVEAEARCKLAREYSPKYAEPVNLLGMIEYTRGRTERAVAYYKQALALKDEFPEALNNYGAVYLDRREYGPAEDLFRQAIEIDPGYINARVNLGLTLLYQSQDREARNEYLKCLEIDPRQCDCRLGLGILALNEEDWSDAKANFQKMTEVCPQDANGFYNLCYTYYRMQRCSDAVDACAAALALKPDYLEAKQNLTVSYECLMFQDAAVKRYIQDIRNDPSNPELHFKLAALYEEAQDFQRALQEYRVVTRLDPQYALAYYRAARLLDRTTQTREMVLSCQMFIDRLRGSSYEEERRWCADRINQLQLQY